MPIETGQNSKNGRSKQHRTCVKCPDQPTFGLARFGLDGILFELPAPLACRTNIPFAPDLYRIETLFGPKLRFLILTEGQHNIIGKIRNIESGLIVKSCLLKITVIVQRCTGYPHFKQKHMRMACSAGRVWGSTCAFECKTPGTYLSHSEPIVCNGHLQWDGHVPECIKKDGKLFFFLFRVLHLFQHVFHFI